KPRSYKEAATSKEWREAMNEEIMALERNHTWEITKLPPRKWAIGCKWVFRLKLKDDGTVERYKARLVAKGYTQLDVNNAFLHGRLDEEIFMTPPEGYQVAAGSVCRLTRSLYGLKQAYRQWNQEFTSQLLHFGFQQSCHDHCLFTKGSDLNFVALLVYVDDVLVVSPSLALITSVKDYLHSLFTIKDLGIARYFLGLQIARSTAGLSLTQTKYIHDILTDTGLLSTKSVATPLPQGIKLCSDSDSLLSDPEPYRRLVGRLLYLGFTRSDISYGVQQLSQFLFHPCGGHWIAALHLVQYLKGTSHISLFFPSSSNLEIRAYCDAYWGSFLDTRRSISSFCVSLALLLFPRNPRSRLLFLVRQPKLNIEVWQLLFVSCNGGSPTFYQLWVFSLLCQFLYFVTIRRRYILWLIPSSMRGQSIWTSIVISFIINTMLASFFLRSSTVRISWLTSSLRISLDLCLLLFCPRWTFSLYLVVHLVGGGGGAVLSLQLVEVSGEDDKLGEDDADSSLVADSV
ncbi:UNVERIFIED_CONTAM: Retrovirus-related Pol polyprotein from transposon RE2, partial [Sesamum radiatum]